ncbi:MAG TPA: hypothetical protein VGV60_11385 [Candidatus Polarisedimenticolia bacterium]|jgi:hypothetical protein|nr:hypothetical protein [Candidatus Polarisedimenticolia bacterium]
MNCIRHLVIFLVACAEFFVMSAVPSFGASAKFKDVCASGCTYTDLQTAINSITDSSASNIYTIFVDSGVLPSNTSISLQGKSYINITGRGMGVSVVQATSSASVPLGWFQNVANGFTSPKFFDLSNSTNITVSNLTIDARTLDPGGLGAGLDFGAVYLGDVPDKIVFDSADLQGVIYGLWEGAGNPSGLIQVFNSKIRSADYAILVRSTVWHIFSSDLRAVCNGGNSGTTAACFGLAVGTTTPNIKTTVWASHLHGESGEPGATYNVAGLATQFSSGFVKVLGSTLHVKMSTANIGSATRSMAALRLANPTTASDRIRIDLTGSELLYESPTSLSQGQLAGIGFPYTGLNRSGTTEVSLVGDTFVDNGGSGGSFRGDIVGGPYVLGGFRYEPTILNVGSKIVSALTTNANALQTSNAALYKTINVESGVATFPTSNTVAVTLPTPMPDANYRVGLSANAQETVYVMSKTTTGFTLKSSNASSVASVDWTVTR